MNKKVKKYTILVITGAVLIFAFIYIAFLLTGGRDVGEFSKQDRIIVICFLVVEVITITLTLIFADRLGKAKILNSGQGDSAEQNSQTSINTQPLKNKAARRHGIFILLTAFLVIFALIISGIFLQKRLDHAYDSVLKILLLVCCAVPALTLPFSIIMKKRYISKLHSKKIWEITQQIITNRDEAYTASSRKLRTVMTIRLLSDVYAVFLGLFSLVIAVCVGALYDVGKTVPLCLYAIMLFMAFASRIRFPIGKTYFTEDETCIGSNDYPELYRLARKAQTTLGCAGNVKISLIKDCNAGISKIGDTYSVQLGAILLDTLSQDELYSVLLHEFSHVLSDSLDPHKLNRYGKWINGGGNPHFFSGLAKALFGYIDSVYGFQYALYTYSSSVINEEKADLTMVAHCDRRIAASALLKLHYFRMFVWEDLACDYENIYVDDEPARDIIRKEADNFHTMVSEKADKWNELAKVEIIMRYASHPTLRMRFETLGVTDYNALQLSSDVEYTNDVRRAIEFVDEMHREKILKTYTEDREEFYLKPKEEIEKWELAGKPINETNYADLWISLSRLGRVTDSIKLLDRVISELPESSTYHARYIKGIFLLHQFDPAGLPLVYETMEYDSSYINEGLGTIGDFCYMSGRQDDLDYFRQKMDEFTQEERDGLGQSSR